MKHSLFITFEGPEGGGKTTQIELLRKYLSDIGLNVLVTRQPGGDPVGAELRKILLTIGRERVTPRAELLMMMADRAQSVETIIGPHLALGGVVICDRYVDSSIAYQGAGRGIDQNWIDTFNYYATSGLLPAITFLLDIDPAVGIARQNERNLMELEDSSFHTRVRESYLRLASTFPNRFQVIDAASSIDLVHEQIKAIAFEALQAL
jgi:dTMP kinase